MLVASMPTLVTLSAAWSIVADDTVDLLQTMDAEGRMDLIQDDPVMTDLLSPNHDACTPSCKWSCESAKCAEICEPECRPPVCETRCEGANISGCVMECDEPHCAVHCPAHMCPNGGCPSCSTTCSEPMCKLKCDNAQPCRNVCEKPDCHWNCKAPEHCPAPVCNMVCESPADCQGKTYEALPPLPPGQMAVRSFSVTGDAQEASTIVNHNVVPFHNHDYHSAEYRTVPQMHAEPKPEPQPEPVHVVQSLAPTLDSEQEDPLERILGKDLFGAVGDLSAPLPVDVNDINASLGLNVSPFGTVTTQEASAPTPSDEVFAQPQAQPQYEDPRRVSLGPTADAVEDFLNGGDTPALFRKNLRAVPAGQPSQALTQVPVHIRTANANGDISHSQMVLPVVSSNRIAAQR